jgi:uncharacterized protein (DUF1810 family)
MAKENSLQRFIHAQEDSYKTALAEIKGGRKRSHWMWYIFPQIKGLGYTETSKFYAIKGIEEAEDYLNHPLLSNRLIEICNALLALEGTNANQIFGSPDDVKLKSSMTLFSSVPNTNKIFQLILVKFYNGTKDSKTLELLHR